MALATSRREFLKLTGIGSAGAVASQLGGLGFDTAFAAERAARRKLEGATQTASICPYCAVGCGTMVASKKDDRTGLVRIVNIEGNPDSPISSGSLCPKGAATFQLAVNDLRVTKVMRRKPNATDWDKEEISYDAAMDRIAELVQKTREETFVEKDPTTGKLINQTTGIFALGGATNDNEENYLILKVMRMTGVVRIENQARI
ncbi:MAG: twin-arginine translocation signal domain-containing protein [Chloroflexi bacterium]|nr:twin-arginine translocation signal domain-containing protein [Chloroflexota bacterium]